MRSLFCVVPAGAQLVMDMTGNFDAAAQLALDMAGDFDAAAQLAVDMARDSDSRRPLLTGEKVKLTENVGIKTPKLCDDSVQQYSGYIPFTGTGGNQKQFFFWLFESRSEPSTDPLIMWLSGGPGCSSQLALFGENGPCSVNEDGKTTTRNPYSWNTNANVMWVDQPAQTGFSEGHYVYGEAGVKEDMFAFLQAFYKTLPKYKTNQFYIMGESYGGHYVPAIASRIVEGGGEFDIPLAGLAIGNGSTNPEVQYKSYEQMMRDGGKSEGGTTAPAYKFSSYVLQWMETALPYCTQQIVECNNGSEVNCKIAFLLCNYSQIMPYTLSGYNQYDVRKKCEVKPLCYDFSRYEKYLNDPEVQTALGVDTTWRSCNWTVNLLFRGDFMKSYDQLLPPLLKKGIKVLIYAGDADYICNWIGNKRWTLELNWDGAVGFNNAEDEPVLLNGEEVGRQRTYNGFSFFQIYGAGHLVPMDKPAVAHDMIQRFMAGKEVEYFV